MSPVQIFLPIEVGQDALDAIAARLERHLFGRAKRIINSGTEPTLSERNVDAGNPWPAKPALFDPLCGDCDVAREEHGTPCATHARACESCGRSDVPLHDGEVSRTKAPLVELWCNLCDPPTLVTPYDFERTCDADPDPWDLSATEQVDGAIKLSARELCDGESGRGSGCPSNRGDRAGYDAHDDRADIDSHERTTSYPWGPR